MGELVLHHQEHQLHCAVRSDSTGTAIKQYFFRIACGALLVSGHDVGEVILCRHRGMVGPPVADVFGQFRTLEETIVQAAHVFEARLSDQTHQVFDADRGRRNERTCHRHHGRPCCPQ